ncbi:PrgI family protein [Lentzea sp. NPDC092896]|uniref:PrgI family protein n=1 Tax=Lentzea sp. NPDC092896 TaxID=3364127 RepID=UPI00381A4593
MTAPVRIPANVDMHDRVLGPLTARQLALLAGAAAVLYLTWVGTSPFLPPPLFLTVAVPFAVASATIALGKRDGVPMDKLLLAALRQRLAPRHRVTAPDGVLPAPAWLGDGDEAVSPSTLQLPAEGVTEAGVVDLGVDGLAVVAVASTVNFALRTPNEQDALVASFGRYLHSLTAPVQVLVRTDRLDLSAQIAELRDRAGGLPHPALEAAALEHADYLAQLGTQTELLRRQVLLVVREPIATAAPPDGLGGPSVFSMLAGKRRKRAARRTTTGERRAAEARLVCRLGEAIELLAPAGIAVTPLDASQATAVLASACNPDSLLPPSAGLAAADEVITTSNSDVDYGPFDSNADNGWDYDDEFDDDVRGQS